MATPQAQPPPGQAGQPSQPPQTTNTSAKAQIPDWLHYGSWSAVILGPIALFMPPRRVGFRALFLATGTSFATEFLAYEYTGEFIYQRFARRWDNMVNGGLPEKARRTQELMRAEREKREAALPEAQRRALQEERERREMEQRGVLQRLWMGSEKDNWREERAKKDKEALEEGKGYGDLIVDQVKEVFGSKKDGENKNDDSQDNKKP